MTRFLFNWRAMAVVTALGVGFVVTQTTVAALRSAAVTTPTNRLLNPFNPTLTTTTATVTTVIPVVDQPVLTPVGVDPILAPSPKLNPSPFPVPRIEPVDGPIRRPPVRDPDRPPTRSPFRP